jgi:organic hydroperoxide reductase OsmC/OhrA
MKITALINNASGKHEVTVPTGDAARSLIIPPKAEGGSSAVNGGKFLMFALATCYCNDLYREAQRHGILIERVDVEAAAEFPGIGLAPTNIRYRASVLASAPATVVAELLRQTDAAAEVRYMVRAGTPVELIT